MKMNGLPAMLGERGEFPILFLFGFLTGVNLFVKGVVKWKPNLSILTPISGSKNFSAKRRVKTC
jgi:hypothetical protein